LFAVQKIRFINDLKVRGALFLGVECGG